MNKLIVSVLLTLGFFSSAALADVDYGLEVGIRSQSGDATATGISTSSRTAMQFGAVVHYPISNGWHIRSGMLYTQRPLTVKDTSGNENKVSLNYLDVPVAVMYKFEDYAGVFGGIVLGMNLDKSCDAPNCVVNDVQTPIVPLIFGATFKFAPHLGATIYFESYGDTVAKIPPQGDLKNYRAVGANLLITFN